MKILIIRFSSAGDILCTTPLLRAVRRRWPDAHVTFLTKEIFADILSSNPNVDAMIRYGSGSTFSDDLRLRSEIRSRRFDLIVDLHSSLRSRLVSYGVGARKVRYRKDIMRRLRTESSEAGETIPVPLRYLAAGEPLGLVDDGLGLDMPVTMVTPLLPDSRRRPVIAVAPGAHHFTKRWPGDRFAAVLSSLIAAGDGSGVLVGGPDDQVFADEILMNLEPSIRERVVDLTGATGWLQTGRVIADADVLLSNDSVAGHIAAAVGTPVVSIFGSTLPSFGFAPFRVPGIIVEEDDLSCRPCTRTGRAECPRGDFRCMLDIDVARVTAAALDLLNRSLPTT